jgi:hypothetical protein
VSFPVNRIGNPIVQDPGTRIVGSLFATLFDRTSAMRIAGMGGLGGRGTGPTYADLSSARPHGNAIEDRGQVVSNPNRIGPAAPLAAFPHWHAGGLNRPWISADPEQG